MMKRTVLSVLLTASAGLQCFAQASDRAGERLDPQELKDPRAIATDTNSAVTVTGAVQNARIRAATNSLRRVHVFVSGRVQGVGFRNFVRSTATVLEATGWVRNLEDGRVELVGEGSAASIEELMKAVAKGPGGATVDKVDRREEPHKGEFQRFETVR